MICNNFNQKEELKVCEKSFCFDIISLKTWKLTALALQLVLNIIIIIENYFNIFRKLLIS